MDIKFMKIYRSGIENLISISDNGRTKESIFRDIKISLYYLLLTFFNKKRMFIPNEVYINKGNNERYLIPPQYDENAVILRGKAFTSVKELIYNPSFVSMYDRKERLKINVSIIKEYIKKRKQIRYLSMWIEYCWILKFIQGAKLKRIASCGHYDEITTWLAFLSKLFDFKTVIIQHGFVSDKIRLAHRIPCDEVVVFDNNSLKTFKTHIIFNEDCIYKIQSKPFIPFHNINRHTGYKYIGIIEQCNPAWVNRIIETIADSDMKNIFFVIMLHPLSNAKYANRYGSFHIITTRDKIKNLDLLIMECSTLAIDYYTAKITTPVLFTNVDGIANLSEYPFIYVESDEMLLRLIVQKLEGKL